jgi:hypothetical protein
MTANSITEPLYFLEKNKCCWNCLYSPTYTMAGAVGTPGNGITPNGTIQVGQGFVKTTSNSVAFTNTMRRANTENQILRTTKTEKQNLAELSKVLNL